MFYSSSLAEFCQFLLLGSFLSSLRLLAASLSKRLLDTFPRWLVPPLPCSLLLTFFPLRSSLQWAEKHTCQIQVAHCAVSHPHQLLSTRLFDPNKFFQRRRGAQYSTGTSAPVLSWSWWMQQLFSVNVRVTEEAKAARWSCSDLISRKAELLETTRDPQQG